MSSFCEFIKQDVFPRKSSGLSLDVLSDKKAQGTFKLYFPVWSMDLHIKQNKIWQIVMLKKSTVYSQAQK